jgi:SAM-dependent methyltransferase
MASEQRPQTAEINARLWGERAQDWAEIQEEGLRPVYVSVFDRVGLNRGTAYLDVGCGAGVAAQIAAERGARVTGLDATPNLLAIARARVPAGDFHLGDLEKLPFPDKQFDLVTGFNSFQYAGNPGGALGEARRVTKTGGHVLIKTWGDPDGMEFTSLLAALRPLQPPAPPGAPGPFALSNETALRAFAAAAGLEPLDVFDIQSPRRYSDLSIALRGLSSSGNAIRAIENSSEAAVNQAYTDALMPFRQTDGSYVIRTTFRCLLARA